MFTQNIKRNKNKTMSNANILQDHETHDPNYLEALSADQAPEGADQVGHLVGGHEITVVQPDEGIDEQIDVHIPENSSLDQEEQT